MRERVRIANAQLAAQSPERRGNERTVAVHFACPVARKDHDALEIAQRLMCAARQPLSHQGIAVDGAAEIVRPRFVHRARLTNVWEHVVGIDAVGRAVRVLVVNDV